MWGNQVEFKALLGKTLTAVEYDEIAKDQILFRCDDGKVFKMYHGQDCCESVYIDDVAGDFADLIGEPLLIAEESTSDTNPEGVKAPKYQDSFTWTFYKLATAKGYVDIRWYGESNGYYSESVDLEEVTE